MNKHQYEVAHREAERLHNKVKDLIDDRTHHLGRELLEIGHRITTEIRLQKNPRSIEGTVKAMVQALERVRTHGDQVMDFRHTDMFIGGYESLQGNLRKFENY